MPTLQKRKAVLWPAALFTALSFGAPSGATQAPAPLPPNAAREILNQTSAAFNQAARQAVPAVVSVQAIKKGGSEEPLWGTPAPQQPGGSRPSLGIGSGIVIRSDGVILTSNHVV